jgi:predicted RNA binding protein with dsRBD fold (UPF0201 family)
MSDEDYIKQLEEFIIPILPAANKLASYVGLSNFVQKNSEYLARLDLEVKVPEGLDLSNPKDAEALKAMSDNIADFEGRSMTNMLKFAGDLLKYNETLDTLREKLIDEGVTEDEIKHIKGGEGWSLEGMLRGRK